MPDPPRYRRDQDKVLLARARELRKNLSPSEARLWKLLRKSWMGYRWRRQEPLQGFIVDFLCNELKLVIEVDGLSHERQVEYDERRTAVLEGAGYHVVRITNAGLADANSAAFEKIAAGIEFCRNRSKE